MDERGQASGSDDLEAVAALVPTAVGILVVSGVPEPAAAVHVERVVRAAVKGGMVGGRDLPTELAVTALERATEPSEGTAPAAEPTPVEVAVRSLPWEARLATLATPVLGPTRLGTGRPDQVAATLGARIPSWDRPTDPSQPSVTDLLVAAVEHRSPAPDPGLPDRLARAGSAPARVGALAIAGFVLAALLVTVAVLVWSPWGDGGGSRSDDGMRIRQWVAVLDTGPTPASLAGQAAELGRVVGVYAFTDRWSCYDGFTPEQVDDEWFLGIGSVDRSTVEELVTASGREPLVTTEVFQTCVLPPPSDFPAEP